MPEGGAVSPEPAPRTITCLLNAKAGRAGAREAIAAAVERWRKRDVDITLQLFETPSSLLDAARRCRDTHDVVAAAGGDGTISTVTHAILGGSAALGVVPVGTLNHFARDAKIPLAVDAAVDVLVEGRTARVDVGDAGGRAFINTASLGLYFQVLELRERWRPFIGKWPALAIATLVVFAKPNRPRLELTVGGTRVARRLPVVWLGNNVYEQAWPRVGTRKRLDEGCLTLVLLEDGSRARVLADVARVLAGGGAARHVEITHVDEVVISDRRRADLRIALDGELCRLPHPLKIAIRPKALRLRVPVDAEVASSTTRTRCHWASNDLLIRYHDDEWGRPVHDDRHWFELLILEGAQAGLSWDTILKKREAYRAAFDRFDPALVARYTEKRIDRLLANPGIVRNRLKIRSTVTNARAFLAVQEELGSFDELAWGIVGGRPLKNAWTSRQQVPARTAQSDALSKELKRRGFTFVGSTICYALMQAGGLVDDHVVGCFRHRPARSRT